MEDREIVAMYWARNPDAIAATQEKYGIFCYQLAWRVLSQGEDAQECVNDTYLAAWNAMPPHRPQVLSMFLVKLLRRIAINRLKHNLTQKQGGGAVPMPLEELSECLAGCDSPENQVVARELSQTIRRFVKGLPPREQSLFVRRYFFTETLEQIAADYAMTQNHVAVMLHRTRRKLKAYLIQEGYLYETH